jgi:hypothetical protein
MADYQNNPIYDSDIRKIQGPAPTVIFQYEWDDALARWVPAQAPKIDIEIGEIEINLSSTNAILSGISGVLEAQGHTNDGETHRLLSGISGVLGEQSGTSDEETHRILSGFSGTNEIKLQEVKSAIENIDIDLEIGEINITGADLSDEETHRLLSGISGQDECNYLESQRLLRSVKDSAENLSLSVEELKKDFRELTFHKKTFYQDAILGELTPTEPESQEDPLFRKIHNMTEREDPLDYPIIQEGFQGENEPRIEDNDSTMPFSIRMEDYKGGLKGWHSFFPLKKKLGNGDRVQLYNEDNHPIEMAFQGGDVSHWLYQGYQIELSKQEAYQLFIRNKYAIESFDILYSVERMYVPEEASDRNDFSEFTGRESKPEQTRTRIGLGSVLMDNSHLYVKYMDKWKRIAIASWEISHVKTQPLYTIDYFDAHTDASFLYLNTNDGERRVAIADWQTWEKAPLECHNRIWADNYFLYTKVSGSSSEVCSETKGENEWRRYAISTYQKK